MARHPVPEWYWWMALSRVPGIGCGRFDALVRAFGSPEEAFWAPERALERTKGIGRQLASLIARARERMDHEKDLGMLRALRVQVIHRQNPSYPALLGAIPDPPPVVYVRGRLSWRDDEAVAVVGTREPTPYGRKASYQLGYGLAERGVTVVSGLAAGCDSEAHRGALAARGRTIAVLGCGIDRVYPPGNLALAEAVRESGAVISEYGPGFGPARGRFAARNRLISGLSHAVVVVEAGSRSGALITARLALEQGREVMCVPGSVFNPKAEGPHGLLRDGAALVRDARDVIEEIGPIARRELDKSLSHRKRIIYNAVSFEPVGVEEIISRTGLEAAEVSAGLLCLEMKGLVLKLPGNTFRRRFSKPRDAQERRAPHREAPFAWPQVPEVGGTSVGQGPKTAGHS